MKLLAAIILAVLLSGCATTSRVLGYTVNHLCNLEPAEAVVVKSLADTITTPNQVRIKCFNKQQEYIEIIPADWNQEVR
jgi:hypothetical protein